MRLDRLLRIVMLAANVAHGQALPTTVPRPLVAALLESRGMSDGVIREITVGSLPAGFPAALLPPVSARTVGGMRMGDEIVAVFADSSRRLAADLEGVFGRAGFKRPPPSPGSGFMRPSDPGSSFCSDSGVVSAAQMSGANRDLVRVSFRRDGGSWACGVFPRVPEKSEELVLPPLTPPADVRVMGGGSGVSGGGVNSRAEIMGSRLVTGQILAHYAEQLRKAGWRASAPAVSDKVAAQFFETTSASGTAWAGVLMVVGGGASGFVSLDMRQSGDRR